MSNSLPISELISLKNLPVELSFLETSGSSLLNEIRYDDYKIGYSNDNKTISHVLHLISNEEYGLTLPGLGFRLILNRDLNNNNSGFWINIHIYRGILAHFKNYKISTFSEGIDEVFNIISKIFDFDSAFRFVICAKYFESGINKEEDWYVADFFDRL